MKIELLNLKRQYGNIKHDIDRSVMQVLESAVYILGDNVKNLETEIANYTCAKHGIGVANGTDALYLVLKAYGIGEGDEVITTPFTFFATAEVISNTGAKPVFVDVDLETYNIDPEKIEEKITEKTKAIIPVHIFGQPADMDKISDIANKYNLIVIEDACQAIGSEYKGKKIGSISDVTCFSFFPTKNLGAYGDGGMVVTNDDDLNEKLRMLRFHGQKIKYYNETLGYNSRLDELQASILRVKLRYLDSWNNKRKELAYKYNELLKETPLTTPKELDNISHTYHLYILQSDEKEEIMNYLKENGVASAAYYPLPLHLQKAYENLAYHEGDFPNAEYLSKRTFAIPLFPELNEEEQLYIVEKIKEFYDHQLKI